MGLLLFCQDENGYFHFSQGNNTVKNIKKKNSYDRDISANLSLNPFLPL